MGDQTIWQNENVVFRTLDVSTLNGGTLDVSTLDVSTLNGGTLNVSTLNVSTLNGGTPAEGATVAKITDASVAHALNATFSDVEVEDALNALGAKINLIIDALEAFNISATS